MFANIDHRWARRTWLTVVTLCLHVDSIDTTYAQSKERGSRDQQKPIDVANACLARGDNNCVVRALEGKASSAMELGILIETYRALEEPEHARPVMEQYVQRFPDAPRAHAYRRMLETARPQSAPPSTSAPPAATPQSAPSSTSARAAPSSASAGTAQPSTGAQSTTPRASTQSAPPAASSRTAGGTKTPLEEATACRAASDDHCIVRALEGKTHTAEELGMLCEAYRELGDNRRARAAMQQYVDRFPNGNFSAFYREQLTRTR